MTTGLMTIWTRIHEMFRDFLRLIPNLFIALLVFAIFFFVGRYVRDVVKRLTRNRRHARNLGLVLGRLAQGAIVLVGIFVSLSIVIPSIRAGDVVQLLGISGVAIGFAFRDILQNFLAGILILLTEPFEIDDQIIFKEFEGTVEQIQTRATMIKTYDGRRIVIPNSELFTNTVTVNTAFDHCRLEQDIGIDYNADIDRAKALILEALRETEGVLRDPAPDTLVVALADSSVNIRARWWVKPPRRAAALDVQDRVLVAIKKKLDANGIAIPFPTRQVFWFDRTETENDGHQNHRSRSESDGNNRF